MAETTIIKFKDATSSLEEVQTFDSVASVQSISCVQKSLIDYVSSQRPMYFLYILDHS